MGKYDLVNNDGTPFTTEADVGQANEASGRNDNVVTRSLRGGVYGAGSQLTSLADAGAEAAGLTGVSQHLRGVSSGLREQAALPQNAPKVGSFKQLREAPSLGNALEYAGGLVGGSLPVMGAGVAGALATGGAGVVPAMLGATAATMPFEAGEVVQRQQADPTQMARPAGERLRDAVLGGTGAAAVGSIVPGIVGRQVLGKGAGALARETTGDVLKRNALDIPLEGVTEGGGELIKQGAAGQAYDGEALTEAVIGGTAAGGVFAGAGTAADLSRMPGAKVSDATGKAFTSIRDRVAAAATSAKNAGAEIKTEAPKRVASMGEDLSAMFAKARESGGDAVNRVKSGQPLMGDLKEFGSASIERAREMMDTSSNPTAQKVKEWGTTMMNDAGLTPERREQVAAAMANASDRASQATMAGLKETWDKGRVLADKARKLREAFKRRDVDVSATEVKTPRIGDGDVIDVTEIKKSNDYTGANRAIAAKLAPLLSRSQPDLASDPALMEDVSDSVRQAVTEMPRDRLTADATAQLMDTLGDDTVATLDAAFREIGDPAQEEAFYLQLNELAALQKRTRKLEDLVSSALTEESQGMIRADQMGEFTRLLMSHARGERSDANAGPAKRAAAERHFREQMALHFGPKATAVSLAIEKEAGLSKQATVGDGVDENVTLDDSGAEAVASEDGFDEEGNRVNPAEEVEVAVRKGKGPSNEAVMDPALFRANKTSGQNYAAQYMLELQEKYPSQEVVFELAEGSKTHGHVVVKKPRDDDSLSEADVAEMHADQKYPNSGDRIKVGDRVFDSRRIVRNMKKRVPPSRDGMTEAQRLAEVFVGGLAKLTERYGTFEVPDSVVLGKVGNRDLTYGDAKKLDRRTKADRAADALTQEMNDLRIAYRNAKTDGAPKETLAGLRASYMVLLEAQAAEVDAELAYGEDIQERSGRSTAPTRQPGPGTARAKDEAVGTTRVDNGETEDADATRDPDKAGNIHETAQRLSGEKLVNRSNMDGTGRWAKGREARPSDVNLNGAVMAVAALRRAEGAPAQKIAARLGKLLENADSLSAKDARILATVQPGMTPSKVAEIINDLARKYKGSIVTPGAPTEGITPATPKNAADGGRTDNTFTALDNPAYRQSSDQSEMFPLQANQNNSYAGRREALEKIEGGTPNPKARAARVAAPSAGDADANYALTTKRFSLDRSGYKTATVFDGAHIAIPGRVGPVEDASVVTGLDEDGNVVMFVFERDQTEDGGAVLQFDLFRNDAGRWEVGVDGPQEGTGHSKKYAHLFDRVTAADGTEYSKFKPGVFSATETRMLLRTLRSHAKELGVDPGEISVARDTGNKAGESGRTMMREQFVRASMQTVNPGATQTATTRADVEAHVLKVLGPKVGVEWANLTHAGEFQRMRLRDIIRISVHALDPMSVAYHESLHGFFAQLRDVGATDVMNVLDKAASSALVLDQLKAHFASQPAVLAQLKDPEERVAYMYQMWATDPTFRVAPSSKGALRRVADFVRKVLGIWSNDQKALHIMEYFHSGEYAKTQPSVAAAAMAAAGRNPALDNARDMVKPMTRFADAVAATGSGRMRDTEIPSLVRLADLIKREHTDERGGDQGFIQAARVERTKRLNELGNTLMGYEKATLAEAHEALISDTRAPSPEARLAVRAIKGLLAQTRDYMVDAGVDVGDLGKDYFPRVWDFHYISKNQQAFKDMLEPHVRSGEFKGNVDDFVRAMASRDGVEENVVSTQPGMQFKKTRLLSFITPAEAAPFVDKELMGTLSKYVTQATRKAEWHRRLGDGKLEALMDDAKKEGASKEDLELALNYMRGVDGTLGDTMNPHLRRITGNMIVYQNIRLLPLAVFSSIVDPVGIMVRGGTVQDAWTAFKRGMAEIPQSYGKAGKADRSSDAAELLGVIDSALLTSVMGDIYTQGMVGGVAQKINTAFFKYNLMEGLNRSFRVGATEAAMKFVVRHHAGGTAHSARWMAELGLKAGDIKVMPDGRPALTAAEGLSAEQERRVHAALNQWVDGAVLRPDAADKPLWMNDPRWALVSHLKQFVYSFQKVILARVVHEIQRGNYTPLMALAAYVPVMIAADFAKGALQGGGDQPEWKQGWDMGDYLGHGVQRAGLLGVSQFGVDVGEDMGRGGNGLGALVGPTIEQFGDVVQMLGGQREAGSVILKSMPANALYAEYARNGAVDDGGAGRSE